MQLLSYTQVSSRYRSVQLPVQVQTPAAVPSTVTVALNLFTSLVGETWLQDRQSDHGHHYAYVLEWMFLVCRLIPEEIRV